MFIFESKRTKSFLKIPPHMTVKFSSKRRSNDSLLLQFIFGWSAVLRRENSGKLACAVSNVQ
jgi:hypothetical protein